MGSKGECVHTPLCVCGFGFAFGIAEAVIMLLFAWAGWGFGYGHSMITEMAAIYYGYAPTFIGGLFGALWGFIVGFVFGAIVAWVYNFCLCHCSKKSCEHKE